MMLQDVKKSKVLIVDDTPENIQVLMGTLKDRYAIVAAINGEKALKLALAKPQPDLILLDIMMPDITGFEVCQRLRAAPDTRQTPIVFLTALHEMEDHMRAVDVGGDDVLTKPINKLELLLRVKSLLRVRQLTGEVAEQSRLIRRLLKAYVSAEAAEQYLADPASVRALERLESVH